MVYWWRAMARTEGCSYEVEGKDEGCLCGTTRMAKWLSPLARKSGLFWPTGQTRRERARSITAAQNAAAQTAGLLPWRHNSLRHGFCTYRVAATRDVPRTALEAGNSAATIFPHYRALATEAEGKAWFAIVPWAANVMRPLQVTTA